MKRQPAGSANGGQFAPDMRGKSAPSVATITPRLNGQLPGSPFSPTNDQVAQAYEHFRQAGLSRVEASDGWHLEPAPRTAYEWNTDWRRRLNAAGCENDPDALLYEDGVEASDFDHEIGGLAHLFGEVGINRSSDNVQHIYNLIDGYAVDKRALANGHEHVTERGLAEDAGLLAVRIEDTLHNEGGLSRELAREVARDVVRRT